MVESAYIDDCIFAYLISGERRPKMTKRHCGDVAFWETATRQLPGIGTDQFGQFELFADQLNMKFVDGQFKNMHNFYDPNRLRSGQRGPNAPSRSSQEG